MIDIVYDIGYYTVIDNPLYRNIYTVYYTEV